MPLYEYQCEACGTRFEVIQKFSDPLTDTCKVCGKGTVRRLQASPAIQFKGSGWYITDYAKKGGSDSSSSKGTDGKGTSDSKGAADAKSETGTKTESSKKDSAGTTTSSPASSSKE